MGKNLEISQNCSGGLNIEFYGLKREHSHPWGRKWGGRSKNFYPSSYIKGGMAQNVQKPHFDVFYHKIHNI